MWKVTLSEIQLHPDDHSAVADAMASNWLTMGPRTQAFEAAFATALDPDDPPICLAVTNCTAALHLAMLASDVGPGDEVIVPSLTFVATANAVLYTGATVVLADVASPTDLCIDPEHVRRLITARTKAVVAVHYAGQPADTAQLQRLCRQHGIAFIEDNAHGPLADGLDADGNVRALGSIGSIGCFSFFSNKNLATGEGGMLVTRDPELGKRLTLLRSHGMTSLTLDRHRGHAHSYDAVALGWNYRIDELRSALGLSQLGRLPANNATRARIVARYRAELSGIAGLSLPFADRVAPGRVAPHIFPVLLAADIDRARVQAQLRECGVQTSIHYPPIHSFTLHSAHPLVRIDALAVTDDVAPRLLTLPLSAHLSAAQQTLVIDSLRAALTAMSGA